MYHRGVGSFTFSMLCVPYVLLALVLSVLGGLAIVIRGDTVVRLAFLLLVVVGLIWSATWILVGCTTDPALARDLLDVGYGPVSFGGVGLLVFVLGASGRFDNHRGVVLLALVVCTASAAVTWATDWVVAGVHETPSGMFYSTPGWFQLLHVGNIPLWGGLGVLISRRGMRASKSDRWRMQRRRIVWMVGLVSIALSDSLLSRGYGYYPVNWLAVLAATVLAIHSIVREDLFRGRGVDYPALIEVGTMTGVLAFLVVATWRGNDTWMASPAVTAVFLAPLPMLGLVAAWTMRIRRRRAERASDEAVQAIDRFADDVRDLDDEAAVARRLAEVLGTHAPVVAVRVVALDDQGAPRSLAADDAPVPRIDARVRAWLVANPEPLVAAELGAARLGGLRALIEDTVARLDADLVVPLVDRDALVGLALGELPPYRVLRDAERDFVRAAASTAARGLTFVALTREADHLASTAREVELAEAVAHARATGDVSHDAGAWQVLGHYRPAARVAGDVWSCADLDDGRLLVFAGDVVGRGVPSALVSAAVGGVCDAAPAVLGPALTPRALLEAVHQTVRDLGGGTQRVTALAAVLDRRAGTVRWASAGHRGAYVVHPPAADGDGRARLDILAGRSTPLGDPQLVIAEGEKPLGDGDHLVAASDGVVEIRNGRGDPWGDRRLQRILRDQLLGAGDRAARMIVAGAVAHAGDAPIHDDMLVVVVRPVAASAP